MCLAAFMCHNRPPFRFLFLASLSGPVRLQVTVKNLSYKLLFWGECGGLCFNYLKERPADWVYYCRLVDNVTTQTQKPLHGWVP